MKRKKKKKENERREDDRGFEWGGGLSCGDCGNVGGVCVGNWP